MENTQVTPTDNTNEIEKTLRILNNLQAILDGTPFSGVANMTAAMECHSFVAELIKQTEAALPKQENTPDAV